MRLAPLLAALALLAAPTSAKANGRFPASTQLVFHPTDPQTMLLRVTFGVLLSRDGGQNFDWVCEKAVGYGGVQDPAVGLTDSGAVLVAAFEGLATSLDNGCSFSFVDVALKEFVIDVAVDRKTPTSAVAITSTGKGGQSFHVQVLETTDSGKTWAFVGTPIDPSFLAETIDPAPSRPQRLYVSGFSSTEQDGKQLRQGAMFASDDRGKTWQRHDIDLASDKSVFIAAVDPNNPDRVYLRTKGVETDRLLRTDDGGKTFSVLATVPGSMLGFALSPDGSRVAIGGPTAGLLVSGTDAPAFTKTSDIEVACLAWNAQGLHACANPFKNEFSLGRSSDEGKSFEPVLASFTSLRGPIGGCSVSPDPASICADEWTQLKANLGIEEGQGGAGGVGGQSTSGGAGNAGTGNTGAGNAGTGGAAPVGSAGPVNEGSKSSCGCEVAGAPAAHGAFGLMVLMLATCRRAARCWAGSSARS